MLRLVMLLVCLLPLLAQAQTPPPTYGTPITVDLNGPLGRLLLLQAVRAAGTPQEELVGFEDAAGGRAYRIDASRTLTPITCPASVFPRATFTGRDGPFIVGISDQGTVIGSDTHADGREYAIAQLADGTCLPYSHPGSPSTIYTAISNVPGGTPFVVGEFSAPVSSPEVGLLRMHAFIRTTAGTLVLDGPQPNDRNWPTGFNALGQVFGYARRAIMPDNTFVYQAFVRQPNGALEDIDTPSGRDACMSAVNDAGIAIVAEGACTGGGGTGEIVLYWYDSIARAFFPLGLPLPTPDTVSLQVKGLTNDGALVGTYVRKIPITPPPRQPGDIPGAPGPEMTFRLERHSFLALPVAPVAPTPPVEVPAKKSWFDWLRKKRTHLEPWKAGEPGQGWRVVLGHHGQPVLSDGERELDD